VRQVGFLSYTRLSRIIDRIQCYHRRLTTAAATVAAVNGGSVASFARMESGGNAGAWNGRVWTNSHLQHSLPPPSVCVQGGPEKQVSSFCSDLCQVLTNLQNSFIGTFDITFAR